MPNVYRSQQRIPALRGRVRGGLAVVIESPAEVAGLRSLIRSAADLPGDPLANAYHATYGAGARLSDWPGWRPSSPTEQPPSDAPYVPDAREVGLDDPVSQLDAALGLAETIWVHQGEDVDQIALAMALPNPGKRRFLLQTRRPALVLDAGSVRARLTAAGAKLKQFGVALFPKARSRRQANLVEALRERGGGRALPRLQGLNVDDLQGKHGAIVFLHGLMSTDVGTFDRLITRIEREPSLADVCLIGWPHDTLVRIKVNAQDLAELIESQLGPSGLPIVFVCHSRGGLVARAAAVELIEANPRWADRLKGAVTFGTPHEGAELAELGDELLGKVLLLKAIHQTGRVVPLVDALWTVYDRKKIEGITDLRPRSNGGEFLYDLRKAEGRQAKRAGHRVLPMFVVGGRAQPGFASGWLSRRFFGGDPNDLVVALSSTVPPSIRPSSETETDHFSYFSTPEMQKPQIPALDFIISALGASTIQTRTRRPSSTTRKPVNVSMEASKKRLRPAPGVGGDRQATMISAQRPGTR